MTSIPNEESAPSAEPIKPGAAMPAVEALVDTRSQAGHSANDNETDQPKQKPDSPRSLYAALGYFPRCPYQWWAD
ncbi:MAG: hypothetical protein QNJ15_04560 [Erythrobacter sp.]|nr:hypothetical protein [Erythrobacter sp.]